MTFTRVVLQELVVPDDVCGPAHRGSVWHSARMTRWVVGTSGWQYKDWRGIVYPEKLPMRRWFEHYATLFDTVEINNTFYRLPSVTMVEGWAAAGAA